MRAYQVPIENIDLEALHRFLLSDRAPEDSMLLSELDGFLTGIAVGPEHVLPSEWLPLIWGGEAPGFIDKEEAQTILGAIMGRYNQILQEVSDNKFEPVFWTDYDGTLIAWDWAQGFLHAIMLRADAWERLFKSKRNGELLFPILALCDDENGEPLLGLTPEEEDEALVKMPDVIPICVPAIAAFWRGKGPKQISMPLTSCPPSQPQNAANKIGRNDPCPCGSGTKFKKCCGKAG